MDNLIIFPYPDRMTDEPEKKNKGGRPRIYNKDFRNEICRRLAGGETLRSICRDDHIPDRTTIHRWIIDNEGEVIVDGDVIEEGFYHHYTRAREVGVDNMADEIIEISDSRAGDTYIDGDGKEQVDHAVIQRDRLRSDNRKWYLSKMAPKRFGADKTIRHQQLNAEGEATDPVPAQTQVNVYAKDIADSVHAEMEKAMKEANATEESA